LFKKIILFAASFAFVTVAYMVYEWQEDVPSHLPSTPLKPVTMPPAAASSTTQPSQSPDEEKAISFRGVTVPKGESPMVRVFDEKGNARIVFHATHWQPVSDNEFHLTEPSVRLLLPGGQVAYIRSDEGQVVVQRDDSNNYNPKRGWLRGHVRLFVDRTKPEWRKNNPDQADPEQHPEAVVKLWLDDVTFDLDLARLDSKGPIRVQSSDANIEGRGLTLIWNEANRRIKLLRIAQGKRATLRTKGLVQFGVGNNAKVVEEGSPPASTTQPGHTAQSIAHAPVMPNAAASVAAIPRIDAEVAEKDDEDALPLGKPEIAEPDEKDKRIDTYHVVFRDDVVVEQKEGIRVAGRLKADMLELFRDFGAQERSMVEHAPETQPAASTTQPAEPTGSSSKWLTKNTDTPSTPSESTIELRWRGALVLQPLHQKEQVDSNVGQRFHVVATGTPVKINDRQTGNVTCQQLKYHDETQQVWLSGSIENPVTMMAGPQRQITGEKIFLDRKAGIARVTGAGQMIDRKLGGDTEQDWPDCMKQSGTEQTEGTPQSEFAPASFAKSSSPTQTPPQANELAVDSSENVEVSWKRSVEIAFDIMTVERPNPNGGPPLTKKSEYLKSAVFDGQVTFSQPGQSISADHVDVTFVQPKAATEISKDRMVAAQRILAEGNVKMARRDDAISCDRLEVEMTTDDTGRNVPKLGRAFGHVIAKQGKSEIRAADELLVALASVPKKVTPEQQARFEEGAKRCGIAPGSPQWQAYEAKLHNKREIVVTTMVARDQVRVLDPQENLDLAAERLECTFTRDQEIERALIVGQQGQPARVQTGDFYVRGPQISLDMTAKSVEVPGAGLLKFMTDQDLDGRPADDPIPVVVTWANRMSLHADRNVGEFHGKVRAVSDNMTLDCAELLLRFQDLPQQSVAPTAATESDSRWIVGPMLDSLRHKKKHQRTVSSGNLSKQLRKRLASARAVGNAVILSRSYDQETSARGVLSSMLTNLLPKELLLATETQPAVVDNRRLVSGVRVAGPLIVTDLINEHFVVEGPGSLLIEDYRLPEKRRSQRTRSSTLVGGSSIAALDSNGPSQTLFTWQNSMSFLNNRNVALFDYRVTMRHLAGSRMALSGDVAAAMKVDPASLHKGRHAELTCDNLLADFAREKSSRKSGPSPLSRATKLNAFRASGNVRIQDQEGEASVRSVQGNMVSYNADAGMVIVDGNPAKIIDLNPKTGALGGLWRGEGLVWNLKTKEIRAKGSRVLAPGR